MYKSENQIDKYDEIYKGDEYTDFGVPDLKIVDGKEVKNKKILVFGAGTARDIKFLLKNNNVYAVDFSKTSVIFLKKLGIKTLLADLNKPVAELKNNSFDIVIAKDILEHLTEPSVLLSEIRRVLKPNGYAVINVPNHFFLPMRLRILFGNNLIWKTIDHNHLKYFKEWDYMHKVFFTWNGFQEFVKAHKLKIIKNFWDLGTLNHYSQPELALIHLQNSKNKNVRNIITPIVKLLWTIFNIIFPRNLRYYFVSLSPSLFCASFYVWVKVKK